MTKWVDYPRQPRTWRLSDGTLYTEPDLQMSEGGRRLRVKTEKSHAFWAKDETSEMDTYVANQIDDKGLVALWKTDPSPFPLETEPFMRGDSNDASFLFSTDDGDVVAKIVVECEMNHSYWDRRDNGWQVDLKFHPAKAGLRRDEPSGGSVLSLDGVDIESLPWGTLYKRLDKMTVRKKGLLPALQAFQKAVMTLALSDKPITFQAIDGKTVTASLHADSLDEEYLDKLDEYIDELTEAADISDIVETLGKKLQRLSDQYTAHSIRVDPVRGILTVADNDNNHTVAIHFPTGTIEVTCGNHPDEGTYSRFEFELQKAKILGVEDEFREFVKNDQLTQALRKIQARA